MKIAIVNDIHAGRNLEYQGYIRAYSPLVENVLEDYLNHIIQQHAPDLIVNLGDLIRTEDHSIDSKRYQKLIELFHSKKLPTIHLVGNHELKCMDLKEIKKIWHGKGFIQNSYGSMTHNHCRIIWIGLESWEEAGYQTYRLPSEQLEWLKWQLHQCSLPTILFTHCPIDDQNVTGNFFYETMDNHKREKLFLENQDEIRQIVLSSPCVIAVLQAHLHYFHVKQIANLPFITCPAMGDNICGPHAKNNVPEVYTILYLDSHELSAKAYSRDYCFAGYESARRE